ncbi:MAG: cation transporter [Chloroflexi bacterium]|nr:cation transporter [Chloroflexota bacterium]
MKSGLRFAVLLSASILLAEIIGGFAANSLALLSDAGHVFTDVLALSLSWFAVSQAERPATGRMTFGYHRLGILVAIVNALSLIGISGAIFYEAYRRWYEPEPVQGGLMMGVAVLGLVANLIVVSRLHRHARHNISVRSAWWHASGDALASVGVIIGGIVILLTGYQRVDTIVGAVIGVIILVAPWRLLREAISVLLEASPKHVDTQQVIDSISNVPGVKGVHDLHVWSISPGFNMLSCHVVIDDQRLSECATISEQVKQTLGKRFKIGHSTLQLECDNCENGALYCSLQPAHEEHHHEH